MAKLASADSNAAGSAGVTPRRTSCSRRMAAPYATSTSLTPAASARRYAAPAGAHPAPALGLSATGRGRLGTHGGEGPRVVLARHEGLEASSKAYPSATSRSRQARSGAQEGEIARATRNRSGASSVAGARTITSPGTPKRARSTSGTISRRARRSPRAPDVCEACPLGRGFRCCRVSPENLSEKSLEGNRTRTARHPRRRACRARPRRPGHVSPRPRRRPRRRRGCRARRGGRVSRRPHSDVVIDRRRRSRDDASRFPRSRARARGRRPRPALARPGAEHDRGLPPPPRRGRRSRARCSSACDAPPSTSTPTTSASSASDAR